MNDSDFHNIHGDMILWTTNLQLENLEDLINEKKRSSKDLMHFFSKQKKKDNQFETLIWCMQVEDNTTQWNKN